ncbi:nucleoprotein [Oropsylla silantiewi mononega-like virus 2]|uniref:Nucleoprotein n=1 Tax=Oropsylla silantiewi mononega-like virus 2 TaxID=2879398 RepID=A0AAV2YCR6_9VIRU|nr:nucleoprotein [Oropsylla silantiewi mononega-like virus 2]DAZ89729.1 TPA_asm: nucleoprotein [Oropsylla silantiewi mononega-like virus 2]
MSFARPAFELELRRLRGHRLPSILANARGPTLSDESSLLPLLVVAVDDLLADCAQASAWVTWGARPFIANKLSRIWASANSITATPSIMAKMIGELTATHSVKDANTVQDRDSARNKIISFLRSNPPDNTELTSYTNQILIKCRAASTGNASAEQIALFMPRGTVGPVSIQTLIFYRCRGHIVPKEIFLEPALRELWVQLTRTDTVRVQINQIAVSLIPDYTQIWQDADIDTILGIYEGMAETDPNSMRKHIAAAVTVYVASLAKEVNITDAWLERRLQSMQSALPDVQLSTVVDVPTIKAYATSYPRSTMTSDHLYATIAMAWSQLDLQSIKPLTWILEQSAYSNVTALLALADVITKVRYFNIQHLIDAGIPETEFKKVIDLCLTILYDKFSPIIAPKVMVRDYPDLAYIGLFMKKTQLLDDKMKAYGGRPEASCKLPQSTLVRLATELKEYNDSLIHSELSPNSAYLKHCQKDNIQMVEIGGDIYTYPKLSDERPNVGADDEAQRDRANDMKDMQRQLQRAERVDWDRAAKALPTGAKKVPKEDIIAAVKSNEGVLTVAFNSILREVSAVAQQHPLNGPVEHILDIPTCKKKLSPQIITWAEAWKCEILAEYRADPAPTIAPANPITGTLVPSQYIQGPRNACPTNLVDHAPQPGDGNPPGGAGGPGGQGGAGGPPPSGPTGPNGPNPSHPPTHDDEYYAEQARNLQKQLEELARLKKELEEKTQQGTSGLSKSQTVPLHTTPLESYKKDDEPNE